MLVKIFFFHVSLSTLYIPGRNFIVVSVASLYGGPIRDGSPRDSVGIRLRHG